MKSLIVLLSFLSVFAIADDLTEEIPARAICYSNTKAQTAEQQCQKDAELIRMLPNEEVSFWADCSKIRYFKGCPKNSYVLQTKIRLLK